MCLYTYAMRIKTVWYHTKNDSQTAHILCINCISICVRHCAGETWSASIYHPLTPPHLNKQIDSNRMAGYYKLNWPTQTRGRACALCADYRPTSDTRARTRMRLPRAP